MNCKEFRRDLPEWLRGSDKHIEAARMESHSGNCRECAREEALERHLRGAWKAIAEPTRNPEVWPRVAAAIDGPVPAVRFSWRPARLALTSTFALGAAIAVLWINMPSNELPPSGVTAAEEQRAVQMVHELRQIPDLEGERLAMEPPHMIHAAVFLGESERN